jgi:hypothetical protein
LVDKGKITDDAVISELNEKPPISRSISRPTSLSAESHHRLLPNASQIEKRRVTDSLFTGSKESGERDLE